MNIMIPLSKLFDITDNSDPPPIIGEIKSELRPTITDGPSTILSRISRNFLLNDKSYVYKDYNGIVIFDKQIPFLFDKKVCLYKFFDYTVSNIGCQSQIIAQKYEALKRNIMSVKKRVRDFVFHNSPYYEYKIGLFRTENQDIYRAFMTYEEYLLYENNGSYLDKSDRALNNSNIAQQCINSMPSYELPYCCDFITETSGIFRLLFPTRSEFESYINFVETTVAGKDLRGNPNSFYSLIVNRPIVMSNHKECLKYIPLYYRYDLNTGSLTPL